VIAPPPPINFSETCDLRSPSLPCGNVEALRIVGTASHRIGTRNSSNMSRYTMPVTVRSAKKKMPKNILFVRSTKHVLFNCL
jgi:hypothetical protein